MNLIDALSELAYEANRAYLLAAQSVKLPYWSDAGDDLKVEAAKTVTALLTSNLSAEQQHSIWVEVRQRAGWKYGAFYDAAEKLDPMLTEYAGLPVEHRVRDELYRAVVRTVQKQSS